LEQAAQGGGGVTIHGGVSEPWRWGTEGHGWWAWWDGVGLDLGILLVSSSLNDTIILCGHMVSAHGGDGLRLDLVIFVVFPTLIILSFSFPVQSEL